MKNGCGNMELLAYSMIRIRNSGKERQKDHFINVSMTIFSVSSSGRTIGSLPFPAG
jgi:hypothetical protein